MLNHEYGDMLIKNVNVSHVKAQERGFGYMNPYSDKHLMLNYGISFNVTCYCDLVQIYSGAFCIFDHMSFISCSSIYTTEGLAASAGCYLFVSRINASLCNSVLRNNMFVNLFYNNPSIIFCDIEYDSVSSVSVGSPCKNTELGIFLNTFLCKASGYVLCVKTNRRCFYRSNSLYVMFILVALH